MGLKRYVAEGGSDHNMDWEIVMEKLWEGKRRDRAAAQLTHAGWYNTRILQYNFTFSCIQSGNHLQPMPLRSYYKPLSKAQQVMKGDKQKCTALAFYTSWKASREV